MFSISVSAAGYVHTCVNISIALLTWRILYSFGAGTEHSEISLWFPDIYHKTSILDPFNYVWDLLGRFKWKDSAVALQE